MPTLTDRLTDTRYVTIYAHRADAGLDLSDAIYALGVDLCRWDRWSGLVVVAGRALTAEALAERLRTGLASYGVAATVTALPDGPR